MLTLTLLVINFAFPTWQKFPIHHVCFPYGGLLVLIRTAAILEVSISNKIVQNKQNLTWNVFDICLHLCQTCSFFSKLRILMTVGEDLNST